ncbi:unnamed protein product, partial [marine sediment metagenome]
MMYSEIALFYRTKTLVALHAGAVQPNPSTKGINDFPGKPIFFQKPFRIKNKSGR